MTEATIKVVVLITVLLAYLHWSESFSIFGKGKTISPVIFVPGDGGSQLEAKLNRTDVPHYICQKQADWYNLWLNLEQIVFPTVYCWVENIRLYYDKVTRTTRNSPGVEIRVPSWGDPEVVEWIDPTHNKAGTYFNAIANALVNDLGYVRRKNLRAAPYDFRKAPSEHRQFFIDLKELVEDTYEQNGRIPITFITHSMGSPMTLVFLHRQSSEWKRKYIKRLVSLAGAWAGSVKSVKVFAMGDDLDSFFLNPKILKVEEISSPSTAWLMPSPLFWGPNEVLVETPSRNYTMSQMKSFFNDLDYLTGWEMLKDNEEYINNFSPPHVELHCLYGDLVKTVEKLHYKKDDISNQTPDLIMGIGDGTVNRRSLRACNYWNGYQADQITSTALPNVDHLGILVDKTAINYIKSVLEP